MDEKIYDELGSLLLFNKASEDDIALLLKLISKGRYSYIALLNELVSSPAALLMLLDVMSGVKTQFPDRRKIYKTMEKVSMYNFCKARNFSEDSFRTMSKQYGKRVPQVKAIVATMEKFIESQEDGAFDVDTAEFKEDFMIKENEEKNEEEICKER
jgi:hypothetical protein